MARSVQGVVTFFACHTAARDELKALVQIGLLFGGR
ncbi:MAG: hypothetical protein JWP01_3082 [Myxococcales bacterium]|nr:hypothetical protein [Myxococcales bacterium]